MYESGWRHYDKFCTQFGVTPLPLTEEALAVFAAHLSQSVSVRTVRSYLSAVRFYHVRAGLPEPALSASPKLSYVLKGIQRNSPDRLRAQRLPITPSILARIHTLWSTEPLTFDRSMLWAAFCLGFFGFMRSGEFTTSPSHRLDECTLSVTDVSVDSRQNPQVLTVLLRRSKTDQHGNGTHLHLGRTGTSLCPVSAVLAYLAIRPSSPGPLFVFQDGTPLTRTQLVSHLKEAFSCIGETTANYSGHSFRIGAATTAARAGLSDSFIQTLGRWRSSAFTTYIRSPADDQAAASATLPNVRY